ncbi:MAG: hypothetical protein WCD31_09635 [Gillisia sp.]
MLQDHLPLITGFYAEPFNMQAVAKLHQGYEKEDIESVVDYLTKEASGNTELVKDIKRENSVHNKQ